MNKLIGESYWFSETLTLLLNYIAAFPRFVSWYSLFCSHYFFNELSDISTFLLGFTHDTIVRAQSSGISSILDKSWLKASCSMSRISEVVVFPPWN